MQINLDIVIILTKSFNEQVLSQSPEYLLTIQHPTVI